MFPLFKCEINCYSLLQNNMQRVNPHSPNDYDNDYGQLRDVRRKGTFCSITMYNKTACLLFAWSIDSWFIRCTLGVIIMRWMHGGGSIVLILLCKQLDNPTTTQKVRRMKVAARWRVKSQSQLCRKYSHNEVNRIKYFRILFLTFPKFQQKFWNQLQAHEDDQQHHARALCIMNGQE